jgi:hypothetical protein
LRSSSYTASSIARWLVAATAALVVEGNVEPDQLHQPWRQGAGLAHSHGGSAHCGGYVGQTRHDPRHAEVDAIALPQIRRGHRGESF